MKLLLLALLPFAGAALLGVVPNERRRAAAWVVGVVTLAALALLLAALSLTAVIDGFSFLPVLMGGGLLIAGIAGVVAFVIVESRVKSPVLDMRLFRSNRPFAFSNLAALVNYSATFAVAFLVSLYLQYVKGFSPELTGIILVSQTVVMASFSPLAGQKNPTVPSPLLRKKNLVVPSPLEGEGQGEGYSQDFS